MHYLPGGELHCSNPSLRAWAASVCYLCSKDCAWLRSSEAASLSIVPEGDPPCERKHGHTAVGLLRSLSIRFLTSTEQQRPLQRVNDASPLLQSRVQAGRVGRAGRTLPTELSMHRLALAAVQGRDAAAVRERQQFEARLLAEERRLCIEERHRLAEERACMPKGSFARYFCLAMVIILGLLLIVLKWESSEGEKVIES